MATQAEFWQLQAHLASLSPNERAKEEARLKNEEDKRRENEKRKAEEKKAPCYDAILNESGKYQCPSCKNIEGGTLRVITHNYDCKYKGKPYCQQTSSVLGGKRKTRKTKKNNRRHRSYSRRK